MQRRDLSAIALPVAIDDPCCVADTIESLARRYHAELLRVLRTRLPNDQDAADLAQEAYARLLRYKGEYTSEELRRMLFGIARNLLTDHWRWRRLRSANTHLPIDELDFVSEAPSLDRHVVGEQQLARLEAVILAMPYKRRTVFILSRIEGLSNAEIATRCRVSVKTVEKHIALALAECWTQVGKEDPQSL